MQAENDAGIVIVGAGEAGTRAALVLREKRYAGPITLINEESRPPYERPPLSKSTLTTAETPDPAPVLIADGAMLAAQDITYLQGVAVTSINRAAKTVDLQNGTQIGYSKLLLATGAKPRHLPDADPHAVHYLRTYADAISLRNRLSPHTRLLVIGGGFIGLEVAASAVEKNCLVTVVEMAPRILGRAVPAEIAALVAARHRAAGVTLVEGIGILSINTRPIGYSVALADGQMLECDAIAVGIGATPETRLAKLSGLAIENGIRADERLVTSDPSIFTAGDCCSFPHVHFGGRRLRLEAWRNAQDQGRHVAGAMLGDAAPFSAIPWFWSDQYESTLQIAGLPHEGDQTITRKMDGVPILFHLKSGRLIGASAFGPIAKVARDIRLAEMLIESGAFPEQDTLANPDITLKSILRAKADA